MKRLSEEFNQLSEVMEQMKKVDLLLLAFIEEKGLKDEFEEWVTPGRASDYCVKFLTEKREASK